MTELVLNNKYSEPKENASVTQFNSILLPYLEHPAVQSMKAFIQHGTTSTYTHCMQVAWTSFKLAQKLHLDVDTNSLVIGAFLHDFYLYDWHDRTTSKPHHATRHPIYAHDNAVKYFELNPMIENIILSHMWPLPPNRLPQSKEAFIVTLTDKWCSLSETLRRLKKYKRRNIDEH